MFIYQSQSDDSGSADDEPGSSYAYDKRQREVQEARQRSKDELYLNSVSGSLSKSNRNNERLLPRNRYFVKKGFCLITRHVPSCNELNRILIYLKNASRNFHMYA